jgi:hypothetical protein
VGFENTISAFERAKTVYTLDLAATVIGNYEALDSIKGEGFVDLLLHRGDFEFNFGQG